MFWKRFQKLCAVQKVTPNAICKKLEFSSATATHWKKGTIPNGEALSRLADYFECSTDYLLGRSDDPAPLSQKKEQPTQSGPALEALSSAEIQLLSLYRELNTEGKKKVQDFVQDLIDTGKYKKYNPSDFEINA